MPSVSEFAAAAVDHSLDVLPLAAVPLVVTLLDLNAFGSSSQRTAACSASRSAFRGT